jgi:hypothetical protein
MLNVPVTRDRPDDTTIVLQQQNQFTSQSKGLHHEHSVVKVYNPKNLNERSPRI